MIVLEHDPKKSLPRLGLRGGNRFSEKIMLNKEMNHDAIPLNRIMI
jgi:hypothetical protein